MKSPLTIVMLGPEGNLHIKRWLQYCLRQGYNIVYIKRNQSQKIEGITEIYIPQPCPNYSDDELKEELELSANVPDPVIRDKYAFAKRLKTYRDIIKKIKPDIVHSHWIYEHGLYGQLASSGVAPFVQSVWGSDIFLVPLSNSSRFFEMQYVLETASCIVGNSRTLVDQALSYTGWKDALSFVFRWGISDVFNPEKYNKNQLKRQYGYKKDEVIILSIRGFSPTYNLRTILETFKTIKKIYPQVRLILAGKNYGWESSHWKVQGEGITVMNFVDHERVAELMALSDICISIPFSDSFANTIAEAMAMRLFPILSDLFSAREILKDRKNAVLVNPTDIPQIVKGIELYFKEPCLVKEIINNNCAIVRKYFSETAALQTIREIYENVIINN